MTTIAFDIEVAGFLWEEVDEITRGYLLERVQEPAKREAVPESTAFYPCLGKVIAIGMWLVEDERGLILLEGERAKRQDWPRFQHAKIERGDERDLLRAFWDMVKSRNHRLVSFNGRSYDGPVLMLRSAQLGVAPSRNLVPYRYSIEDHCDLMDVFSFYGAVRERFSLDYWCRRFGIESPKGTIDGSQVAHAYREGRIEEIGEYCLRDVRATGELYRHVEETLLPLFARGRG